MYSAPGTGVPGQPPMTIDHCDCLPLPGHSPPSIRCLTLSLRALTTRCVAAFHVFTSSRAGVAIVRHGAALRDPLTRAKHPGLANGSRRAGLTPLPCGVRATDRPADRRTAREYKPPRARRPTCAYSAVSMNISAGDRRHPLPASTAVPEPNGRDDSQAEHTTAPFPGPGLRCLHFALLYVPGGVSTCDHSAFLAILREPTAQFGSCVVVDVRRKSPTLRSKANGPDPYGDSGPLVVM